MDILDLQQRFAEFAMSQLIEGPGNSDEGKALLIQLKEAVSEYGDAVPELRQMATQLEMMTELASDPEYVAEFSNLMRKEYSMNLPIFDAIDDGDVQAVVAALDHWEINATHGEFETTALYRAMSCMCGVSLEVVRLLLDRGADPNRGLGTTTNVLQGLGFGQCNDVDPNELAEVIKRCVALGADLEQRSSQFQWTPLISAASEWNPVAVEALILAGADIHARSGDVPGVCLAGKTARSFAVGDEATEAVFDHYLIPS